ncbi:MAG: substrate-binding domain-containing protein [Methanotrichaceae archaeon]
MPNESDKKVILGIIGAAVAVFILVYVGIHITGITIPPPDTDPIRGLERIIKDINVNTVTHPKSPVDILPPDLKYSLPEISKYPPQVNSSTPSYIEIFSSTEKAGSGTDGWLTEVAKDFNNAAITIDGKQVSVRLRGIPSGQGGDYITSGKYLPDAYTPSNELWGEMIVAQGVKAQLVQKRLAGNVAGILLTKAKKDELVNKYGAINTTTIVDAVTNNELEMGYTDPFASSTGLNFLISALETFDSRDLLSDKAKAGFESFQANIPVVAYTTLQMRESAKSGVLDSFVLEYQTYVNTPDIRSYEFIPFGARHDSPMYAIGELSAEKMKILNKFVEFTQQEKYQILANKYGFNGFNGYQSEARAVSGDEIIQAQKVWKITKNAKPICAVFVADVSGSMDGVPLNNLKRSLLEGQKYIGEDNMVGLIAMKMLIDQKAAGPNADPNLKPRIFVLSDGNTNRGHSLDEIKGIVQELGIPVYTIGYNANIPALQAISSINEGASINADTDDVVYKLGNLFNAEM